MKTLRKLRWILGAFVLLVGVLMGARFSGGVPRSFPVIPPYEHLTFVGQTKTAAAWAAIYQPEVYADAKRSREPIEAIWFQIQHKKGVYYFTYHPVWADETHPNALADVGYRIWRWAFYGAPSDIEAITLRIEAKTGNVSGVAYETARLDVAYDAAKPEHVRVKETLNAPLLPIRLYVRTWNHLLTRRSPKAAYAQKARLEALTELHYVKYKMSRRAGPIIW